MSSSSSTTNTNSVMTIISREVHAIVASCLGGARYGVKIRLPHAIIMTLLFRHDLSLTNKLQTIKGVVLEHAINLAAFATLYKTLLALFKWTSWHVSLESTDPRNQSIWRMIGRTIMSLIVHGPCFPGESALLTATSATPTTMSLAPPGHAEHAHHALLAGAVGGYFVWGRNYDSSVNYQLLLYLTSRVLVGLWKRCILRNDDDDDDNSTTSSRTIIHSGPGQLSHYSHLLYRCMSAVIWGLVMVLFEESPHVLQSSLRSSMDEIYRPTTNSH